MDNNGAEHEARPAADSGIDPPPKKKRLSLLLNVPGRWFRQAWMHPWRTSRLAILLLILGISLWIFSWRIHGWHHFKAGQRALQVDHCRDALEHFEIAIQTWPDDATLLLLTAQAARRAGDLGEADRYLSRCEATRLLVDQAAFERILLRATRGEIDAVANLCEALLRENHADSGLILEALALGNAVLLRFPEALELIDRWLSHAPDRAQAVFLQGRIHLQAAHSQEALKYLRRSVELDPERDDARLLLAGVHVDLGQAHEALPHLEIARRRRPQNVLADTRLAQALVLLGRHEEAIPLLDEVIRKRPDFASALLERGKLALRDRQFGDAETLLRQACKRDPSNKAAYYQLLQCLKLQDKSVEARNVQLHLDKIDRDAARIKEIVTALLPKRSLDADLHAELGELTLGAGSNDEGVRWLERALQLEPQHARAHRALAKYYEELGQSAQAMQHRSFLDDAPPSKGLKTKHDAKKNP